MPTRSWLAKAKDVRELGGLFYAPQGGKPWSDKQDARAEARWRADSEKPLPAAVEDPCFFRSRMHDSALFGIERTPGLLRVRLDGIAASDMASILEDALDLPPAEGPWPVDLLFHDPSYVRAARVDRKGTLRFEDWTRLGNGEGLGSGQRGGNGGLSASFLYDWFWEEDGRLQWIAQFYTFDRHRAALSNEVYLMVDCTRARVEDRCPETFARAYGSHGQTLYEAARANGDDFEKGLNLWNERGLMKAIPAYLAEGGWAREQFLAPVLLGKGNR